MSGVIGNLHEANFLQPDMEKVISYVLQCVHSICGIKVHTFVGKYKIYFDNAECLKLTIKTLSFSLDINYTYNISKMNCFKSIID